MDIDTACELIGLLVFYPGWWFEVTDHTDRFQNSVTLTVHYPALRSEREYAPDYPEQIPGGTYARFPIMLDNISDQADLYRKVLDILVEIQTHEAREFLRVAPTMWAPFHPHRTDGMIRYGQPESDLKFGIG